MGKCSLDHRTNCQLQKMAPVEVIYVPSGLTPVKNLKVVDKALELPLVNSAYSEVTRMASPITPYVESTLSKVTPMVEAGYQTIKSQVEEKVVPHIPNNISESVTSHVSTTMETVTAAVEKVDGFACNGIDQLTEKVPQLKEATPKLIEETKGNVSSYVTSLSNYTASFSAAQVALKVLDAGLDVMENVFTKVGADPESLVVSNVKKVHTTANTVRLSGVKTAGTEKAKRVEEGSILEAILYMLGVPELMSAIGFKLTKAETVYEDDVSRVVSLESKDTEEPVVVDTAAM